MESCISVYFINILRRWFPFVLS
uniref:Uncharacterized protein n=1 Tax=Arundo donax TaxID=35708 RepID=A0A0A8ZP51_ARUDO